MSVSQPYWESELESKQDAIKDITGEEVDALLEENSPGSSTGTILGGLAAATGLGLAALGAKKLGENPDMDRRKFLAGAGTAATGGTAGCVGEQNDNTPTDTDSPTPTDTATSTATPEPTATPTPSQEERLMDRMRLPQGYEENFDDIHTALDSDLTADTPEGTLFNILESSVNGVRDNYPQESSNSRKVHWLSKTPFAYSDDHEAATMTLEAVLQNAHLFDEEFPKHTVGENLIVDNGVFINAGSHKTADVVYENSDGELDLGINLPAKGLTTMWLDEPENSKYADPENAAVFGFQYHDAVKSYMNWGEGVDPSENLHQPREDISRTFTPASMSGDFVTVPEVPLYESTSEGYKTDPEQVIENKMAIRETLRDTDEEYIVLGQSDNGSVEVVDSGEESVVEQTPYSLGILD